MNHSLKQHIDGDWHTHTTEYRGFKIEIKSRIGHGMKAHCIENGKVLFTLRFGFITPEKLLEKMKQNIDKYISGAWTPAKKK